MKNLGCKIAVTTAFALATAIVAGVNVRAQDDDRPHRFSAKLSTFNEVPPKSTGARGTFHARLSEDGTTLNWTFTWSGLTGPPLFAHIHFGLKGANYPVMTFFLRWPQEQSGHPAETRLSTDYVWFDHWHNHRSRHLRAEHPWCDDRPGSRRA